MILKIIILAGGGGTRLFPLSRRQHPKQFLKIGGESSLLIQTVARFLTIVKPSDIIIVSGQEYANNIRAELQQSKLSEVHTVFEPAPRNTAPAIALALRYCLDVLCVSKDEVMFIAPSDHMISPADEFAAAVKQAAGIAGQGKIVTFGIMPTAPETGYGYIQAGDAIPGGYVAASFREKPDQATAQSYIAAGNYYWNSGMFAFTIHTLASELARHQPEIATQIEQHYDDLRQNFERMPNISIDYAVAEKSDKGAVVPLKTYWNDIGSWDALFDVMSKDKQGNALEGDCLALDCHNSLLKSDSRLIAGIGLDDIIVVETGDVILVAKKGETQKVKDIVGILKEQGRREADVHTCVQRPWGSYTVLGEGPSYKMKKIAVNPGQRLSLQMHYHRSEHWVVIGGSAKVTIGDKTVMVHTNESVFIPQTTKHRLENPGRIVLEIIEVQNGDYLEEDDIVRFEDDYNREK